MHFFNSFFIHVIIEIGFFFSKIYYYFVLFFNCESYHHYYHHLGPPNPGGGWNPGGGAPPEEPPPKNAGGAAVRTGPDKGALVIGRAVPCCEVELPLAAVDEVVFVVPKGRLWSEGGGASTLTETIVSPLRIMSPIARLTSFIVVVELVCEVLDEFVAAADAASDFLVALNSSVSAKTRFMN